MAATSPATASADSTPTATASTTAIGEFAPLVTRISQVRRPNCWSLVLRGRLANPYEEAVDGARMIVRLRDRHRSQRGHLQNAEREYSLRSNLEIVVVD